MLSNCGAGEDSWEFPWTAHRSNQSILKEIKTEYSLEQRVGHNWTTFTLVTTIHLKFDIKCKLFVDFFNTSLICKPSFLWKEMFAPTWQLCFPLLPKLVYLDDHVCYSLPQYSLSFLFFKTHLLRLLILPCSFLYKKFNLDITGVLLRPSVSAYTFFSLEDI